MKKILVKMKKNINTNERKILVQRKKIKETQKNISTNEEKY
jgi:hypothetical protein